MQPLSNLKPITHFSLQKLNTLAVPAVAGHYLAVHSREELKQALALADELQLPVLILGGGSNLVLPELFLGLVIKIDIKGLEVVAESDSHVWLRAGAGEDWQTVVDHCLNFHYWGVENLSLIPGTVGAAPIQNIGAYGVELEQVFEELSAVEKQSRLDINFDRASCEFAYRHSVFKGRLKGKYIITSVTLKLSKQPAVEISYPALQAAFKGREPEAVTPGEVAAAVNKIRRSKLPDPTEIPNAGSFFKNPIVDADTRERLKADYPGMVSFALDDGRFKVAAGWLLETAGWKGHGDNGVGMHHQQALVLVNPGRRTGERIIEYAYRIKADIQSRFGVTLELEPVNYLNN